MLASTITTITENSLTVQWLGLSTSIARAWIQSLVVELRSCKPLSMAKNPNPHSPQTKPKKQTRMTTGSIYMLFAVCALFYSFSSPTTTL